MTKEEMVTKITDLELKLQILEQKVEDLQKGEFGTGIYLGGCNEADIEYISGKTIKKEGE